jgi:hypothetical protein
LVIIGGQEGSYPRIHALLCQFETLALRQPEAVEAILDFVVAAAALDQGPTLERRRLEVRLKRALTVGEGPEVTVMNAPGACSQYLRGSNTIVVERSLAQRYEESGDDPVCGAFLHREVSERLLQALGQWLLACAVPHLDAPVLAQLALDRLRAKPSCEG